MISYFHKGKGSFKNCEDSLTASVFDTLKYLPSDMFWSILKQSLYFDKLPYAAGDLKSISYWEKWNAKGTANKKFVEPDLFLRFHDFDLIIEAKRYDKNQQYEQQIHKEIQSYFNVYGEDNKQLYFIQVGGLRHIENEEDIMHKNGKIIMCKTDWTRLLKQVDHELHNLKNSNIIILSHYARILEDTIAGFALHQYYKKLWLKDIKTNMASQYSLGNFLKYER